MLPRAAWAAAPRCYSSCRSFGSVATRIANHYAGIGTSIFHWHEHFSLQPNCIVGVASFSSKVKAYDDQLVSWVDALPLEPVGEGSDDDNYDLGEDEEDEFDKVVELVAQSGFGPKLGGALHRLGVESVADLSLISAQDLLKHGVPEDHAEKFVQSIKSTNPQAEAETGDANLLRLAEDSEDDDLVADLVAESAHGSLIGSALTKLGVDSMKDLASITIDDLTKHGVAVVPAKKFMQSVTAAVRPL